MLTLTALRTWFQHKSVSSPKDLPDDDRAYLRPVDRAPEIEQALCNYRIMML